MAEQNTFACNQIRNFSDSINLFVNLHLNKKQTQWKTEYTLNLTPLKGRFW